MQRQRGGKLYVIGHSSSWTRDMNPVRHNMINFGLSLDRANTVAQELMRIGLTTSDISIRAMSDARPLFFEIMPSGEAGNRRVEIFLDGGCRQGARRPGRHGSVNSGWNKSSTGSSGYRPMSSPRSTP